MFFFSYNLFSRSSVFHCSVQILTFTFKPKLKCTQQDKCVLLECFSCENLTLICVHRMTRKKQQKRVRKKSWQYFVAWFTSKSIRMHRIQQHAHQICFRFNGFYDWIVRDIFVHLPINCWLTHENIAQKTHRSGVKYTIKQQLQQSTSIRKKRNRMQTYFKMKTHS